MTVISPEAIQDYANEVLSVPLGFGAVSEADITPLTGGDYNFNYKLITASGDFVVRICIEPQSGRDDQIAYEYNTLQILESAGVTPKPLLIDNSRSYFPYDILVEEFIDGGHLQFSVESVRRVAVAMAKLHSAAIPEHSGLIVRSDPLREQYEAAVRDLARYKTRQSVSQLVLQEAALLLERVAGLLEHTEGTFKPTSIVHTDPNPANIIDNGEEVFFVDWEQGRIDDPSYDIGAFFCDVLNRWASPRALTDEEKEAFLETYITATGNHEMRSKLPLRVALYTLNASIWAANRIADVDEGKIDANLGAQNYDRYLAMADPVELQKVTAGLGEL